MQQVLKAVVISCQRTSADTSSWYNLYVLSAPSALQKADVKGQLVTKIETSESVFQGLNLPDHPVECEIACVLKSGSKGRMALVAESVRVLEAPARAPLSTKGAA